MARCKGMLRALALIVCVSRGMVAELISSSSSSVSVSASSTALGATMSTAALRFKSPARMVFGLKETKQGSSWLRTSCGLKNKKDHDRGKIDRKATRNRLFLVFFHLPCSTVSPGPDQFHITSIVRRIIRKCCLMYQCLKYYLVQHK